MVTIEDQTYNKHIRSYLMGIAMILVVLYHVSMHDEYSNPIQKAITYIFGNGFLGVEMFFLLSSYGLSYSYNNNTLKKFYSNRFIRLIPLYPLALILTYWKQGTPFEQVCICFFAQMSIGLFDNYFITLAIFFAITNILAVLFYYIQKYFVFLIVKI